LPEARSFFMGLLGDLSCLNRQEDKDSCDRANKSHPIADNRNWCLIFPQTGIIQGMPDAVHTVEKSQRKKHEQVYLCQWMRDQSLHLTSKRLC